MNLKRTRDISLRPDPAWFPTGLGWGGQFPRPPFLLWAPAVVIGAAMLLPVVYLFVRAWGSGQGFFDLVVRSYTGEVLLRSMALVGAVTAATVALALPLAWLTVRTDLPLRRLWSVVLVLPLAIPSYVGGFLVVVALGPRGMLQRFLEPLGVDRLPDLYGFPGATLTLTLLSFPYVLLTIRAALFSLDPALEESARSLGRTPTRMFFGVVLPQLRPAIGSGALLVALYTLSDFGAVSLLRYETFTWAIYLQYDSAFDRTFAAVLSLILVAVAFSLILTESKLRGRLHYHRSTAGTARPAVVVALHKWRWPALSFCALVALASVALPLFVLGHWAVRGIVAGQTLEWFGGAAWNSVYVSTLAAGITVGAALPIIVLSVRYPGWTSTLLERASYVGFALPGIAVALSLVFFGIRYAPFLYQTLPMLLFAYAVLFFPTAIGVGRARLLQISPQTEEVARSLGKSPWKVFATVTLPLMRPGLVAAAGLAFLLTMKELPATLLLAPLGFQTLATSIWSATSEAFFTRAALQALLLVLLSSVAVTVILGQERRSSL